MYNIDYIKLILWLIPEELQLPKMVALVNAFSAPFKLLYNDFIARRTRNIYKIEHNSQVCYLEAALNDSFDVTQRRIYITDGNMYTQLYIFTEVESKPLFVFTEAENKPVYIYPESDYVQTRVDFIVNIPAVIKPLINEYELIALIDFYKLASKRMNLNYF